MDIETLTQLRTDWQAKQSAFQNHKKMPEDADPRTLVLWDMEERRLLTAASAANGAYHKALTEYDAELTKAAEISDREADNIANGQDVDEPDAEDAEPCDPLRGERMDSADAEDDGEAEF